MTHPLFHRMHSVVAALVLLAVAGCGTLPSSGPNKRQIFEGSVQRAGDAYVVDVTKHVATVAATRNGSGFSSAFRNAATLGPDTIRPGDTLTLTIYENVDDGLLSTTGQSATSLNQVQVDGAGFIFVPYAGRILAAGNSPEAIRRIITNKLNEQTPDPQVMVSRLAGDGATVSILGEVGGQGVHPIERSTRTLVPMLAKAGISVPPDVTEVTVQRGNTKGKIWLDDLYNHPGSDIALRDGDRILVERDQRSFTALGATGSQGQVQFEDRTISAIEAIAQVGGLNPAASDPTGVFVLRDEHQDIARRILGRNDLHGTQRMIYVLNLTEPNGLFVARDFKIRDEDIVYVTEAPYTQFAKLLTALTSTASTSNALVNATTQSRE